MFIKWCFDTHWFYKYILQCGLPSVAPEENKSDMGTILEPISNLYIY